MKLKNRGFEFPWDTGPSSARNSRQSPDLKFSKSAILPWPARPGLFGSSENVLEELENVTLI